MNQGLSKRSETQFTGIHAWLTFLGCTIYGYSDVRVQKIKEENYVFLTYFFENAYYYNAVYIIG